MRNKNNFGISTHTLLLLEQDSSEKKIKSRRKLLVVFFFHFRANCLRKLAIFTQNWFRYFWTLREVFFVSVCLLLNPYFLGFVRAWKILSWIFHHILCIIYLNKNKKYIHFYLFNKNKNQLLKDLNNNSN